MRGIGDQPPGAVEQRAGEVEPLADVDRSGGARERRAHLFGNRHEQPVEDLEPDRIGLGPAGKGGSARGVAGEAQGAVMVDTQGPAGFDHRGRQWIADYHRTRSRESSGQIVPVIDRHFMWLTVEPAACRRKRRTRPLGQQPGERGSGLLSDGLDPDPVDHQHAVSLESELGAVRGGELCGKLGGGCGFEGDGAFRTFVAKEQGCLDPARCGAKLFARFV